MPPVDEQEQQKQAAAVEKLTDQVETLLAKSLEQQGTITEMENELRIATANAITRQVTIDNMRNDINSLQQDLQELFLAQQEAVQLQQITEQRSVETKMLLQNMRGFKGIEIQQTGNASINIMGEGDRYDRPFDLYDLGENGDGDTVFKIADNRAKDDAVWIRGVKKTVSDPTSANLVYDTDHWNSIVILAPVFVYLAFERATAAVTIELEQALPSGDDDTMIWPLWYVTVDPIDVVNLRNVYMLQGMV